MAFVRKNPVSQPLPSGSPARGEISVRLPRHGLARVLSRMGVCSRSEAARRIASGRVCVNGAVVLDPETPVDAAINRIELDGVMLGSSERTCIVLNKPRGLLVTTSDEQGRETVYALLRDAGLPWLAPVGRLDKASEGLLLMSNDPVWAARITEPHLHVLKTYRVQIRGVLGDAALKRLCSGLTDRGEHLSAKSVRTIGGGEKNTWLEIVLAEGRNRQIRRMLTACGHEVLRLMRVSIGSLHLGDLPKGAWRELSESEIRDLSGAPRNAGTPDANGVTQSAPRRRSRFPSPASPGRRR
ncbi:MAG TPA: pseudouridine synthase [Rhodanobacteraceae bacterium]|nr:pseudouridine synthase [Rhodanobacteraceae bacterium]